MLLEPDHGHDGVHRVQLRDLRLLAIFVLLGVLDGQPRAADVVVERLAIDAGDADESAQTDQRPVQPHAAVDVGNSLRAQPIDDQLACRAVVDGHEDEIEPGQAVDVRRGDALGHRLDARVPVVVLPRQRVDLEAADGIAG